MFKFLKTIKAVKKLRKIEPSGIWLRSQRLHFASLFKSNGSEKSSRPAFFRLRLAAALVMIALIVGLGGGAVNSAQAALPTDALYALKLLAEQFQSFLIIGSENKIDFALQLAEKRLAEANAVATSTNEQIIVGTIARAQGNLEQAETILRTISSSNNAERREFKELEKAFKKLDKLAERKHQLADRITDRKFPAALAALKKLDVVSVNIGQQANQIIITFTTSTAVHEQGEQEEDDEDEDNDNDNEGRANRGTLKIIELLTRGAGKSGKIPPGLLKAPGIRKHLGDIFNFPTSTATSTATSTDTTAPLISSVSVSNVSSTSAAINWTTNETTTGKIYYSTSTPVILNSTSTLNQTDSTSTISHSLNLTNLNSSSTYHFIVEAKDSSNNIATSTQQSFTTSQ